MSRASDEHDADDINEFYRELAEAGEPHPRSVTMDYGHESWKQREAQRESLMRQVRLLLAFAKRAEPIDSEAAKAFEARAAIKLSRALHRENA